MINTQFTFEVEIKPQNEPHVLSGVALGRMSLDKQFHGDLKRLLAREKCSPRAYRRSRICRVCGDRAQPPTLGTGVEAVSSFSTLAP